MNFTETALTYHRSGLTPLPAIRDEKRPRLSKWKQYQTLRPSETHVNVWFEDTDALCVLTGESSGNLELIDFDFGAELFNAWCDRVAAESPDLLNRLVIETTQSGGMHVVYRCADPVSGNLKLAQREIVCDGPDEITVAGKQCKPRKSNDGYHVVITLIETRGEGGLFLCDPTPGYEIVQGDMSALPVLSADERELLLMTAWSLNEYVPPPVTAPLPSSDTFGLRPGDDYNQRGDIRSVLQAHGWVLVSSSGDSELWRRPGKAKGWSASLKDGAFYIFSTNAAPFESGRAYSRFAVYAMLNHNGDFDTAARELRAQGYGEAPSELPTFDISGIVSAIDASPLPPAGPDDPGPIADHLLHVPGFINDVMQYTLETAPYPNPVLAFSGALVLQSYLAGRKVRDETDVRTNLYLLALANSGTGKEHPRKVNQRILVEAGVPESIADGFASGEGIEDRMQAVPSMLFQTDEIDGLIRSIDRSKDARHETIMNVLLKFYTSSSGVYPMRVKAGGDCSVIDQPSLTLLGTAVPKFFYEALTARMLNNGFFARLMVVEADKRGKGRPARILAMPDAIRQTARWWVDFKPGSGGNLSDWHPEPAIVPSTPEARQRLLVIQGEADERYSKAEMDEDPSGMAIWARAYEKVLKLALLYAISENHLSPSVGIDAVNWAWEFVDYQTKRMLYMTDQYVAESEFEDMCNKLVEVLTRWRSQHGDEWVGHRWVGQKIRGWKPQEWEAVREALADREVIEFGVESTPGRRKYVYRLRAN